MKKTNKVVSSLLTLTMLGGLVLPAGVFAATDNYVNKTMSVADDFKGQLSSMELIEDSDRIGDFVTGDTFVVTLPSDVSFAKNDGTKWVELNRGDDAVKADLVKFQSRSAGWATDDNKIKATLSNERTMNIEFLDSVDSNVQEKIILNFNVIVDGFDGDITATIDGMDSGVTSGEYIIGRVAGGDTTNTVLSVEDIGESNEQEGGIIRIQENAAGTWDDGSEITLTLNNDFYWNSKTKTDGVSYLGGMSNKYSDMEVSINSDKDELKIDFKNTFTKTTSRGIVEVKPYIDVDTDADYGEVEVDIDGEDVTSETLVIANYADYGVKLTLDGDLEEVIAGQRDQELTDLIIEETIPGSLVKNRKITIELPTGVKFLDNDKAKAVENYNASAKATVDKGNIDISTPVVKSDKIEFSITDGSTSASKIKVEFKKVNLAADFKDDIAVKLSGSAGIDKQEVVVGTALPAITATTETKQIKLGVQNQAAGDITITEAMKGAILDDADLILDLPEGMKFAKAPKVAVTEGNLDIDEDSVKRANDDRQVVIPIDKDSTRASTIKITGIELTADRAMPAGDVYVKIKGAAVAETYEGYDNLADFAGTDDLFTASTAATVYPATIVNAAPTAGSVQFNIGSSIYQENGVARVMDAAPYIKDSRTYVPVRYLAMSLGVSEENIGFENGVVTLTKGDTVVQMTVGSKTLTINDAAQTMDVAPEIVNGRTMLPARFVAEAFGAQVGYANGTVVIAY